MYLSKQFVIRIISQQYKCAELAAIVNEATILATKNKQLEINMKDL
ncbi:hypothetical protein [Paulownia witches'-broom phytoplasma]|nr:hypothetical protein PAWBP_7410 [Paulownia witches'-broom phytoplasma]